jgi:hypothetical protein
MKAIRFKRKIMAKNIIMVNGISKALHSKFHKKLFSNAFGVHSTTISNIKTGNRWSYLFNHNQNKSA